MELAFEVDPPAENRRIYIINSANLHAAQSTNSPSSTMLLMLVVRSEMIELSPSKLFTPYTLSNEVRSPVAINLKNYI